MPIHITCPHCGQQAVANDSQAGQARACTMCGELLTVSSVTNRFPGAQASDRFQFSLRKMLGVVTVACVLLGLFVLILPAITTYRGPARRNQCINNLKNLGLSLHNHHDIHNRLPLASSRPRSGMPGSTSAIHPAGYSWHVAILPFMEEVALYDQFLEGGNDKLQADAFDPAFQPELGCTAIQLLQCPSDSGDTFVDTTRSEYITYATAKGKSPPARSNYVAFAATHFASYSGPGVQPESASGTGYDGSGIFPFPIKPELIHRGLSLKAITDGTSHTAMLAETREPAYSAWMDGQATWVVGAWPEWAIAPSDVGTRDGFLGWDPASQNSRIALGLDPINKPGDVYLSAARFGTKFNRTWGPSSEHPGGGVNHLFADGHVVTIMPDLVDHESYLRLFSRNGGEPISIED